MAATEPDTTNAETTQPVETPPKKKMMQHPVYFVSSLLQGARSRYSGMQKLLFGLLMASRKLRHYFQAHEITVVTRFPLQRILHNPDAMGRIVEWALELSSFGLKFESTLTIQSRVLAEFIAEWTATPDEEAQGTILPGKEASCNWIMYFDGTFSLQGAGAGVLIVAPTGEHLKYVIQMHFPREVSTNNTAEYEGLLACLRIAADLESKKLIVRGDSQLVVKQVNKDYQSPLMKAYVDEVRKLEECFDGIQAEHVPRAENDIADYLSKHATLKLPVEPGTFVLQLTQPSVDPSTEQNKRRKSGPDKYFPAELPGAAGKNVAGDTEPATGRLDLAGHQALAVETTTPIAEEMPLVLAVEPQAPAWAQHTVRFLQTWDFLRSRKKRKKWPVGLLCTSSSMTFCTGGRTV